MYHWQHLNVTNTTYQTRGDYNWITQTISLYKPHRLLSHLDFDTINIPITVKINRRKSGNTPPFKVTITIN